MSTITQLEVRPIYRGVIAAKGTTPEELIAEMLASSLFTREQLAVIEKAKAHLAADRNFALFNILTGALEPLIAASGRGSEWAGLITEMIQSGLPEGESAADYIEERFARALAQKASEARVQGMVDAYIDEFLGAGRALAEEMGLSLEARAEDLTDFRRGRGDAMDEMACRIRALGLSQTGALAASAQTMGEVQAEAEKMASLDKSLKDRLGILEKKLG